MILSALEVICVIFMFLLCIFGRNDLATLIIMQFLGFMYIGICLKNVRFVRRSRNHENNK